MQPRSTDPLRAALVEGAARADGPGAAESWQIHVGRVALCELAAYPEQGICSQAECMAVVVVGLTGPRCGSALVGLEPPDALRWIGGPSPDGPWYAGDASAAIAAYADAGGSLAAGLCSGLVPDAGFCSPTLVEDSLPSALISTHAPRDTLVLSAELVFTRDAERFTGYGCVLVDAKVMTREPAAPPSPEAGGGA